MNLITIVLLSKSDELRTPLNFDDEANPVVNPIWPCQKSFKRVVTNYTLQEEKGRKIGVQLSRTKITRSLGDARKIVRGDEAAQYAKLREYAEELLRSNPKSTMKLGQWFVHGYRPLIGLDTAFLKTFYGG
ncbi:hypothetical protein Ahy_B03g065747 isoform B [Arachis hypogaea]|uniref:Uncharacterized protein n=1 Tax=Arachis hypogaea TaxID=3818 RepID=A0A445A292_ARAHY|nr:hypothetical protein Ahy_B03g065747 isoform B [Arachis hypogaea]